MAKKNEKNRTVESGKDGQIKAASGYKFAVSKSSADTKPVPKGAVDGVYIPKPTAAAKAPVKAPAKKTKYKSPSNKKVFGNVKAQNKRTGGITPKCK